MYNGIKLEPYDIDNLGDMEVNEYDDKGVFYSKKIKYLTKSIRLSLDTLLALNSCTKVAFSIYIAIFNKLDKDTNVVTLDRSYLKKFIGVSDSAISRGIKELEEEGLVIVENKNTFIIPITSAYKGNLNNIIKKYKDEQKRLKELEEAHKSFESLNELNRKRKLKLKVNGSKSKEVE